MKRLSVDWVREEIGKMEEEKSEGKGWLSNRRSEEEGGVEVALLLKI